MNEAAMKQCVVSLAQAKNQQNILGALEIYHPQAALITIGLNAKANGHKEIKSQLELFFAIFPDYHIEIDQIACNQTSLLATGLVNFTPNVGVAQARIEQPAALSFQFKDNKIVYEVFYLDFGQVCRQANLSIEQLHCAIIQYSKFLTQKEGSYA